MKSSTVYTMKEGGGPANPIEILEAPQWNKKGFGIFWTLHEFNGSRTEKNLTAINGFAVDIDGGDKPNQLAKIAKGLLPTHVIETKNGHHVYWMFEEPMQASFSEDLKNAYMAIMVNKLLPFYGADKNARDLARILRAPFYLHLKDPNDPFMIKPVVENEVFYTWESIDNFYEDVNATATLARQEKAIAKSLKIRRTDKLFEDIYKIDCMAALEKLSGTPHVMNEVYSFRRTGRGTYNINVNGKSTSCWVDQNGRIGSLDKGGPTIWQWLFWFQKDHKRVYEIVKEVFL